jgi:hypothetical protein
MATLATNFNTKTCSEFSCEKCNYITNKKSSFETHKLTRKHFLATKTCKNLLNYSCTICHKEYADRTGLWRHSKKCTAGEPINEIIDISEPSVPKKSPVMDMEQLTVLFIDTVKQNQELQKQNQDFQQKMFEIMKDGVGGSYNAVNSNNTNSNNSFNLNFFLNETCKDAMNIKEFIDSIQVHFKDLEYTGENGYAAGISNIFLRELNQLDVCKRPIHCSDAKREVFHIKNEDSWEKERELLIKCIKQITRKNVILLADWREAHPGCMDLHDRQNDKYNKINSGVLGSYLDEEEQKDFNKIIASVAKATVIKKK